MPDLGKYAVEVTLAYSGSFVLLAGLIAYVWWRSVTVRRNLRDVESRNAKDN